MEPDAEGSVKWLCIARRDYWNNMESSVSLEYLAGIFDGEGSIMLNRMRIGNMCLTVQLNMADDRIPKVLHSMFGGTLTIYKYRHYRPQTRWKASVAGAIKFLELVGPLLIVKSEQAKIGLEFQIRRGQVGRHRTNYTTLLDEMDKEELTNLNKGLIEKGG